MLKKNAGIRMSVVLLLAVGLFWPASAFAQSSLGIGTGEATVPSTGLFSGLMLWVNTMQQDFYRAMTGALKSMREDQGQIWILVGLSFAYGVFHAAGPGHGKAVISSYMLANEVALRRGVLLSFVSSMLQGAVAVLVIGLVFLVLHGTTVSMGDATRMLETASYGLIAAFGAWLLWKKLRALLPFPRRAFSLSAAAGSDAGHGQTCHGTSNHGHHHAHGHGHQHDHAHDHAHGEICPSCGHSHAPDPGLISGDRFTWRTAWTAVAAVGMRPCSGALIVLTFAFLNGLWVGGIVSVFAMAIGTAITVSALAVLAVTAKNAAVRFAGGGVVGVRIQNGIEIAGALFILLIGLVLLGASLSF